MVFKVFTSSLWKFCPRSLVPPCLGLGISGHEILKLPGPGALWKSFTAPGNTSAEPGAARQAVLGGWELIIHFTKMTDMVMKALGAVSCPCSEPAPC